MKIDIDTRMITLIGTPLNQSFAARMQNAGYEAAGLNMLYFYTEADQEHLGDIINGIRHMNFAGFAVTKPNKVEVLRYLDELDPLCRKIGACNTVVKAPDGRLIGYNTDCLGFYESLTRDGGVQAAQSVFFCFGSGGVGRAMCFALAHHNARKIYITDTIESCAKSLVSDINKSCASVAEFVPCGDFSKLSGCNVILNASGVGMGRQVGKTPLPKQFIRSGQFFFDACYNPERTQFLMDAGEKGCKTLNGLSMSLYQGAAQIELWTGRKIPIEVLRRELLKIINETRPHAASAHKTPGTF